MSISDYVEPEFKKTLTTGVENRDAVGMAELLGALQLGIQANLEESGRLGPFPDLDRPTFLSLIEMVKIGRPDPTIDANIVFGYVKHFSLAQYQLKRFAETLLEKYAPKPKIDDDVIIVDGAAGGPVVIRGDARMKAEREKAKNNYLAAFDKATETRDEKDALADRIKEKEEELRLLKAAYEKAVKKLKRAEQEEASTEREFKRYRNT